MNSEIKQSLHYLSLIHPDDLIDGRYRIDGRNKHDARVFDNRNRINYERTRKERMICLNCCKNIMKLTQYMHVKMKCCKRNKLLFDSVNNILSEYNK